jgi:hypothetical protein
MRAEFGRMCGVLAVVAWLMLVMPALLLGGCSSVGPRTTRLTTRDLDDMATVVALNLRNSEWMAERGEASERVVIAMEKVENLTDDVIPRGEQWAIMAKVRGNADMVRVGREKAIVFVMSKDAVLGALERGTMDDAMEQRTQPTHEMSATLRNATRSAKDARTDVYVCEFRITSLATREVKWLDTFEVKRQAFGLTFD